MPCMIAGASEGMAPAWLATSRAPPSVGMLLEALPLDPEPARVDRVVEPAGELPHVLGAAPLVDVAEAGVGERLGLVGDLGRRGHRHEGTDPPCLFGSWCHGPGTPAPPGPWSPWLSQKSRSFLALGSCKVSQRCSRLL